MSSLNWRSICWKVIVAIAAILGQQPQSGAQATVGIQPFGSYSSGFDVINQADLGVHIDIPLFVHKGRGSNNSAAVHLIYDTSYNDANGRVGDPVNGVEWPNIGWRIVPESGGKGVIHSAFVTAELCAGNQGSLWHFNVAFEDITGYSHQFPGVITTVHGSCPTYTNPNQSTTWDGYFLSADLTGKATVTSPSGVIYLGQIANTEYNEYTTLIDTNGNSDASPGSLAEGVVPINSFTGGAMTLTDSSNISVTITAGGYNAQGTDRLPAYVQYKDVSGNPQTITITYKMYPFASGGYVGAFNVGMVDAVAFPDGSTYHFTYQPSTTVGGAINGLLSSVTLPTGGTISYMNTIPPYTGPGLVILPSIALQRTTTDGSTTYQLSAVPGIGVQNFSDSVTKQDGSEIISFVQASAYPGGDGPTLMLETAHNWNDLSGARVRSTMKCYNGNSGDCTSTPVIAENNGSITQISTSTTLENGLTSKQVQFFNNALPIEKDEYDYGASTPTRITFITYASLGNNIQDHLSYITIYDGSFNQITQTFYGYDDYPLTSSGISGLSPVTGSRGNLTTISRSNAASSTESAFSVTIHTHYDDAGQVVSTTDGNGNVTSYGHDSTDSVVTNKIYPPVAAGTFSESYTPDPNTGLLISSTDVNKRVTAYTYDSMLRKTGVCFPDGGYTLTSYPSPTMEIHSVLMNGSGCTPGGGVPNGQWVTSTQQYDGYGRLTHSTDPGGNITDTNYDQMGRVYSVSNPHASGDTVNNVYYFYDTLGRKWKQTNQDGSVQYWCYNGFSSTGSPNCNTELGSQAGSWVDFQDENGNDWQNTSDAFGNLIQAIEPNGISPNPSMETDYTYDVLNDLTSVTQWGGKKGSSGNLLTRRFAYDGLSHLRAANNPENASTTTPAKLTCSNLSGVWTNCYEYDANGNMREQIRNDGVAISSSYDALNRVTNKTGGDNAIFAYDGLDDLGRPILGLTNVNGRLTYDIDEVYFIDNTYSYDPMGRIIMKDSCPGRCSEILAGYDLAGNLTSLSDSDNNGLQPIELTYGYDSAGRLGSITSGWTPDSNHPTGLFSTSPGAYGSLGLLSAQLGTSTSTSGTLINLARTYDTRGRLVSESDTTAAGVAYSYSLGFTPNGNVGNMNDSIMGQWGFGYDSLNRLTVANVVSGSYGGTNVTGASISWTYDPFGNRTAQSVSNTNAFPAEWAQFSTSGTSTNQATATNQAPGGLSYDAVGNVTYDGVRRYVYDSLGRLCGIPNPNPFNPQLAILYQYDAEGHLVGTASGSIQNCNGGSASYSSNSINNYVVGLNGERLSETSESYNGTTFVENWHTNVFADGKLLATINSADTYFALNDSLGTKRTVVGASGCITTNASFAFGDGLLISNGCPDITEHHFTGKEHDQISGNDYFGARYYQSTMGRFLSPDDGSDQRPSDPQSWNLYGYVRNNPLTNLDPDGRECVANSDGSYTDGTAGGESCHDVFFNDAVHPVVSATVTANYSQDERIQMLADTIDMYTDRYSLSVTAYNGLLGAQTAIGIGELGAGLTAVNDVGVAIRAAEARASGRVGEGLAGIVKNTTRIPSATGTASYRIPDVLDKSAKIIGEVKNIPEKVSLTSQLRDDIAYAQQNGFQFVLYVRNSTTFTQPLQQAIDSGLINVVRF